MKHLFSGLIGFCGASVLAVLIWDAPVLADPVLADPVSTECPPVRDRSAALVEIVENMQAASSEARAQPFVSAMWEIWFEAPDEVAQSLLDKGMAFRSLGDYGASRDELSLLIEYCPEYAEGYNQRAFAAFLDGKFDLALEDLDVAIDLQPVHLGALTGKVFSLIRLERHEEAQAVLRFALEINPWLAERALLDVPQGDEL